MTDESLRMNSEGGIEHDLALFGDPWSVSVVDHVGRQQAKAGMAMLIIVPGEKGLAERPAVLNRSETIWKVWPVLKSAKLAF